MLPARADGLHQVRVDGFDHPGGHGTIHAEVGGRDFPTLPAASHDNFPDPLPQVAKVTRHGKYRHQFFMCGILSCRPGFR